MTQPRKPPPWFKWAIWGGIALAAALPTTCMLTRGELPTHKDKKVAPA